MTARILRIELLRSVAPMIAAAVAVLGTGLYYLTFDAGWQWAELAFAGRAMLILFWPMALAAGAWQGLREYRSTMNELITTTPRPRWRRVIPTAAAMAVGAAAGYLGMFLASSRHALLYATYFSPGTVAVVVVGALAMVVAVWLGMVVGARLPSPVVPPTLGVAGVALMVGPPNLAAQAEMPGTVLFLPILMNASDLPPEYRVATAQANLAQLVWFTLAAGTALLMLAAGSTRGRILALLLAVLGAVIVLPLQPASSTAVLEAGRDAIARVCTSDPPQVCVPRAHEAVLDELRVPAREALEILTEAFADTPTSVVETYRYFGVDSTREVLVAQPLRVGDGRLTDSKEFIVWLMLDGAGTPQCSGAGTGPSVGIEDYAAARQVVAAWLIGDFPATLPQDYWRPLAVSPEARPALEKLRRLPADEQRARVTAFREAELTCAGGDRMDMLIGANAPR